MSKEKRSYSLWATELINVGLNQTFIKAVKNKAVLFYMNNNYLWFRTLGCLTDVFNNLTDPYLGSVDWFPSPNLTGVAIEWSLFMETQLGPGEAALSSCAGLEHNTHTPLLSLRMVSWRITAKLWDGQPQTTRDLLWLLDANSGDATESTEFEGPQLVS